MDIAIISNENILTDIIPPFSQLYHDGFGPHASLLEQAALNTNRAVGPSDRLKQMLSLCAHTVREVDNYFDDKYSTQPCMCNCHFTDFKNVKGLDVTVFYISI